MRAVPRPMNTEQIIAVGRVIERLLACGFAGLSLALGWNLFKTGVVAEQTAEFTGAGWKATLKKVGPGVFFALFGACVLGYSIHSPLDIKVSRSADGSSTNQYLYRVPITEINGIDIEFQNHALTAEQAYSRLRDAVLKEAR